MELLAYREVVVAMNGMNLFVLRLLHSPCFFLQVMIRQFLLAMVLGLIDFHSPMVPCLVQSIIVLNLSLTARHWPHLDLYDNRLDFMLMFLALIGYQGFSDACSLGLCLCLSVSFFR